MAHRDGSTILRTSLAAGLIGLALAAAGMEVHTDLRFRVANQLAAHGPRS